MALEDLQMRVDCPVKAQNAGLFISRGNAAHPTRIIDSHELLFVTQGRLEIWEDEQEFVVEAGGILRLWPGRRHGSSTPMPPDLRFYWIHYDMEETNC
ncbi:MAG: AraC family ligand binding domain-containing protein, partial [Anaerolineae bacterium]|nr:AraC family ligand binding domain-containing protein [Anaerolineae bacterium]